MLRIETWPPADKAVSDSGSGKFDRGVIVSKVVPVSRGDGTVESDLAQKSFDRVSQLVEVGIEGRFTNSLRHEQARRELEQDRQAVGIDRRLELGRQPAFEDLFYVRRN